MANLIWYKDEVEKFVIENGWKLFLDKMAKEHILVMERPKDEQLCCRRQFMNFGDIRLEYCGNNNSIELWIGGEKRYEYHET